MLPPARDNQAAADVLGVRIGTISPFIQWVAVRPDTLRSGDVSGYEVHEGLVSSLFRPRSTNMANVAHFMCALASYEEAWARWRGEFPVIVNAEALKR
ncbi:MAG TPA: hypothetical protein PLE61_14885 [Vicinamibacterales bacterium]|nr:hypothetical protein [Vicinamibacterales bacterium]HPW22085.1 hypothetical protein [Vicinamibacterales bacterium]